MYQKVTKQKPLWERLSNLVSLWYKSRTNLLMIWNYYLSVRKCLGLAVDIIVKFRREPNYE
jgi:hypothetical protein